MWSVINSHESVSSKFYQVIITLSLIFHNVSDDDDARYHDGAGGRGGGRKKEKIYSNNFFLWPSRGTTRGMICTEVSRNLS